MKIKYLIVLIAIFAFLLQFTLSEAQNETELPLQQNDTQNNESDLCENNENCDDNESCTLDECIGTPKECIYVNITSCISGDNCCPMGCDNCSDSDCGVCNPCINMICNSYCDGLTRFFNGQCLAGECSYTTESCNDGNDCTVDTCSDKECLNKFITKCISGDDCCPPGCRYEQDGDCQTSSSGDRCTRDRGCDDGNPCTEDLCEGKPKKCSNRPSNGCILGDRCLSHGTIESKDGKNHYCDLSNTWKPQKEDNALCKDDYECISNKCSDGACINPAREPPWWKKWIDWILKFIPFF